MAKARKLGKKRVCSVDKLWLLKYASKEGFRCHSKPMGYMLEAGGDIHAPYVSAEDIKIAKEKGRPLTVYCCTYSSDRPKARKAKARAPKTKTTRVSFRTSSGKKVSFYKPRKTKKTVKPKPRKSRRKKVCPTGFVLQCVKK